MIRTPTLMVGKTYIVTYRLIGAKSDSQLTGKFLYSDDENHYFDCRPSAGTQKVSRDRLMRLQIPKP